ncbi:6-phosphogluconolactonase [Veillonella caviae]|uniref:6-phosphogluconolactonase n=1 Tax=Veillonella caviae TaxID=248316 RepID=UPI002A80F8F7|nr:6-phosphogluconolactonase [Veillonella caviae]MDY4746465.1 6-phosphogluconolactonase [Veillonella caviae]
MGQDIIKSYVNSNDAIHALAENFIAFTDAEIKRTDSCIVGITGGTVINGLLELLNTPEYIERINWERTFFVWTDERFLSQAHEDNYFNRVKQVLLCKAIGAAHFFPIHTDSRTVVEAAEEYEKEIKNVLKACKKEGLDLAILDLGEDGHTAGLFAGSHALREIEKDVVAVEDGKVWERISMTFHFLAKTDCIWFTVMGEKKRAALTKVLYQREDYEDTPWEKRIGRVLPGAVLSQDNIVWYVDEAAYPKKG